MILQIRKAIARACKKAGIEKHVYPHLFRHSVAAHLLGKNINLRTIQNYLGHKDMETANGIRMSEEDIWMPPRT